MLKIYPKSTLDAVTYRVGVGNFFAVPQSVFTFGDMSAVTLDHVIAFKDSWDAQNNYELWAHELQHVMQYEKWGIGDFALKYTRDYQGIEREAEDAAANYIAKFYSSSGFIKFSNQCNKEVNRLIQYSPLNGTWISNGYWTFAPNSSDYLGDSSGMNLRTDNQNVYFYAESPDGTHWGGNYPIQFDGRTFNAETYCR